MSCFPCFSSKFKKTNSKKETVSREPNECPPPPDIHKPKPPVETKNKKEEAANNDENRNIAAQTFTFRELASATKNFRQECLLGEGGFGRVYKGKFEASGQVVAVKQLDRNGLQGNKEFLVEVLMLSLLHHQNLVNLIGYCADGDQRLLVYEYMSGGSLEDHLLDIEPDQKPLDWFTRMKIALGAARGLEYLHDKANPPVIYRDLKSSNILLDEELNPKLSDFGLAKLGPVGDKMHVSSRVMGTYGYCAPEYARIGELTLKSDVYSFGVVLLELITGRRVIDTTRLTEEQNVVTWAQPIFKNPKRFPELADPLLTGVFPERGLNQAVAIVAMCLQEEASVRPLISDIVTALSFLSVVSDKPIAEIPIAPLLEGKIPNENENLDNHKNEDEDHQDANISDHSDSSSSNSSHKNSRGSQDGHNSLSCKSSMGSQDGSVSSSHKSSRVSQDGSASLSRKSSSGLQLGSASSSRNSSRKSQDESVFSSHNNRKSQDESVFSSHNSSRKSLDESASFRHNNSMRSQDDGSVSSSHNSNRGSHHGSASLSHKSSRGSLKGVFSSGQFSQKLSRKSSNASSKQGSPSLSRKNSAGSEH